MSKFEETTLLSKENRGDVSFRPKYFAGFRLESEEDEINGVNLAQLLRHANPTRHTASHIESRRAPDSRYGRPLRGQEEESRAVQPRNLTLRTSPDVPGILLDDTSDFSLIAFLQSRVKPK